MKATEKRCYRFLQKGTWHCGLWRYMYVTSELLAHQGNFSYLSTQVCHTYSTFLLISDWSWSVAFMRPSTRIQIKGYGSTFSLSFFFFPINYLNWQYRVSEWVSSFVQVGPTNMSKSDWEAMQYCNTSPMLIISELF